MDLSSDARLNHRFPVERGVRAEECGAILKEFFRARRAGKRDGEGSGGLGNGSEIG
jgi:tRNA(adenine34) deaminase